MTSLRLESYAEQCQRWPSSGRHVLAQFEAESVVVYQAFRPEIAEYAVAHGGFGGPFSLSRMSWIKTNFLWMMYRCGWATKTDQERILAVWIRRAAFDGILGAAVASRFEPTRFTTPKEWRDNLSVSDIRLQWDPDHNPVGAPVERRAVQLGLRAEPLRRYAQESIVKIEDISEFVHAQSPLASARRWEELQTPDEAIYPVSPETAHALSMSANPP